MSEIINSTNNSGITASTRLSQDIIEKKQQPYFRGSKCEMTTPQDTVEISGKEPEQKWYQKYKKGLITAGVGALAIGAAIFGHKKISAEQIKKAEQEAKRLEEEAKAKAEELKKQAEEKARLDAEKQAQLKAQKEAEARLKAEAEEKARLDAEKRAEEARIEAQKAAELKAKEARNLKNRQVLTEFATTSKYDFSTGYLIKYGKDGIPLKYSRDSFLTDLKTSLDALSPQEKQNIERRFNLRLNPTSYNSVGVEIEGIPKIPETLETESEKNIAKIIKNFTEENETMFEDPTMKELYDAIIQTIPEFTSIVGKKQHNAHNYSVDIHTLMNLCANIRCIKANSLDNESQQILKYSTLLHDLGKNFISDGKSDTGHATRSVEIAEPILERLGLPENIKERILKQIKNHHWFKEYNKGNMSPQEVVMTFGNLQDLTIAEIMAKSDLVNVNDSFHLMCTGVESAEEYGSAIAEKFKPINEIVYKKIAESKGIGRVPDRHGIIPISCDEEYYEVLDRLQDTGLRVVHSSNGYVENAYNYPIFSETFLPANRGKVPNKLEALLAYVGIGSNGNGHYMNYELYSDLNRFLSKNSDVSMPKIKEGALISSEEGKKLLEDYLVNIDSETAKDFIRCVDYSLKELDKQYGRYEGLVYRNGNFSADGGQYWSTSLRDDLLMFDKNQEYHVIKTRNGHKVNCFDKDYNKDRHSSEKEILLSRDGQYREVTGSQYEEERREMARSRYEWYKKFDEENYTSKGQPPKYNFSFEDILARTHVWEKVA